MAQQTSVSSLLDMTSSSNVVFLGEAGSGKSEIALNFAQALAELGGKPVHFFDLDMTKPLFRSRDRREALEALGVEVHYEAQFMDAPTLTGGVRQRLNDPHCCAVLDVGGDYIGARSIGGYAPLLNRDGTTVYYVINPFRPWSATLEHIDQVLGETLGVSHVELARLRLVGIKILHRLFQLKSSAADIRKCMSTDFDLNLFRKGSSRFILSLPVHEYIAGHDDRFCLFSGGCQISLYK